MLQQLLLYLLVAEIVLVHHELLAGVSTYDRPKAGDIFDAVAVDDELLVVAHFGLQKVLDRKPLLVSNRNKIAVVDLLRDLGRKGSAT